MTEQRDAGRGLDVLYTKVAVDFQNLSMDSWEATLLEGLAGLQPAVGAECAFFALFDSKGQSVADVHSVSAAPAKAAPDKLKTMTLANMPWLSSRLAHLKLSEVLDSHYFDTEMANDFPVLKMACMRSMLTIAICVNGQPTGLLGFCDSKPRDQWDPNLHLLLKLIGSSLASGLERLRTFETFERERERNELALYSANDGLWDFDTATNKVYFSPRWKRMLGYDENAEQKDLPEWRALVHPDDLARVQAGMRDHLDGRTELFESVHRMRHRNGEWRWMLSRAKARPDKNGRLRRLVGVELDITERKLYEEALFREKESAQITLQSIGDGVITTDADCLVEYLNPVAEGLTGWKLDEAAGRPVDDIFRGFHEETCEPLENALAVSIRRKRSIKSIRPTLLIRRDGNELYIESTASPIRDGNGAIAGGVLVFHDVSESRELNRRLSYHASHDILTGLVNRREFESRLEHALEKAKAGETSYAVCYMDLDQFKMVNDSCGHTAGDALLSQLGSLLKAKIRWRDTLARLGGDEFGLLIESCSLEESMEIAETLRKTISDFKFVWDERTFNLGVSIGLVPVGENNDDMASVLSAADSACAAAKDAGRDRVHCFRENDIEMMRRRREMQWAARINNALDENRFELFRQYIQPLSDAPDLERGDHYELLLRMRDSNGALISPDVFISAAERYNITPAIDRWVIEHALDWLLENPGELSKLAMCSINLSGQSLGDDKFLPFVINEFRRRSMDGSKICFEITETAAVQSFSQANRFINSLKELGCKFALDDFGTGLSSFAYLKSFPVDFLKIDGSFVKGILHDPIDREMVRSINSIGKLTGKKTIAEFAENAEIIEQLRELGVDYAQGYGVAEPRRVSDVQAIPGQ
ncbi:MAG: EAL domain-containing protein [Gammaproteobacteria bacterium]